MDTARLVPLRVAQWGLGNYGRALVRLLHQNGAMTVAAIDRHPDRVGRDVGVISGIGRVGVSVVGPDAAESALRAASPDVCIVATRTQFREVYDQLLTAARLGIDCITLSEEAFYPWTTEPELARRVDEAAREHSCVVTASGMNDTLAAWLLKLLAASSAQVTKLRWTIQYNADDGGRLAREHGVGSERKQFEREVGARGASFYSRPIVEWLRAAFGWKDGAIEQRYRPIIATEQVTSAGGAIPAGHVIGMHDEVMFKSATAQIIEVCCSGKVYTSSDRDFSEGVVTGVPNTTLRIDQPAYLELTCASLMNRIPQLSSAPRGYVTTERWSFPRFTPIVARELS